MQDDSTDDLSAFGVAPNLIPEKTEDAGLFEIWEDNYDAIVMFSRLQTQWNVTQGVFLGLSYPAASVLLKIYQVEDEAEMMDDLIAMERAALPILNKREG